MSFMVPSVRNAGVAMSTYIDNFSNFKYYEIRSKGGIKRIV